MHLFAWYILAKGQKRYFSEANLSQNKIKILVNKRKSTVSTKNELQNIK